MAHNYIKSKYKPKHPEKYVGDVNSIQMRSSWERKFAIFLDTNPNVLNWGSEQNPIIYFSPVDNNTHKYYPDFMFVVKESSGEIKKYMVEIKPHAQTKPPVPRSRKTKQYLNEMATYTVNTAKWNAANTWCEKNGFVFMVIDEYTLGLKRKSNGA